MKRNNGNMEIRDIEQVIEEMQKDLNDVKVTIRSWFNRKIGGVING